MTYNVLFLCTGNSARSILGEAIVGRAANFRGFSAGSMPKGQVNPNALRMLSNLKYDVSGFRSKSWEEFAQPGAPVMDFIFTVCDDAAGEVCPVWPGQPVSAHWGQPDPAAVAGSEAEIAAAFAEAYRMLNNRIAALTSLPLASLDRLKLKQKLDAIGQA